MTGDFSYCTYSHHSSLSPYTSAQSSLDAEAAHCMSITTTDTCNASRVH